jgi:hypothetical protein
MHQFRRICMALSFNDPTALDMLTPIDHREWRSPPGRSRAGGNG